MGRVMKYPHRHTVRLTETTERFVQEEANMPDVDVEPAVLLRQLVDESIRRRHKRRAAMKGSGD